MKKTKIILLTILIMLVIYCGAVIFVTKPEGFDVSSFFATSAPQTEPVKISLDPELKIVDKAELKAELKAEVESELKAELEAKLRSELQQELRNEFTASVESAVNAAVDKKVSSAYVSFEAEITESMNAIVNNLKAELEAEESSDVVVEQLEIDLNALASQLYVAYKDDLVQSITPEVLETVLAQLNAMLETEETEEAEKAEETPVVEVEVAPVETSEATEATETTESTSDVAVEEDYYTIRERIRNEEINDVLSQLN